MKPGRAGLLSSAVTAVPLNLSERSARQSTGRVGVVLVVTLSHNSRRIDVDINLQLRLTIIASRPGPYTLTPTVFWQIRSLFANAPRERQ